jgi:hypothetical protein
MGPESAPHSPVSGSCLFVAGRVLPGFTNNPTPIPVAKVSRQVGNITGPGRLRALIKVTGGPSAVTVRIVIYALWVCAAISIAVRLVKTVRRPHPLSILNGKSKGRSGRAREGRPSPGSNRQTPLCRTKYGSSMVWLRFSEQFR